MRHAFISLFSTNSQTKPRAIHLVRGLVMALLIGTGLLVASPAIAQAPADDPAAHMSYGNARDGEVTSQTGAEHFFRGCSDETVDVSVFTDGFAPRLELYAPDDANEAIASAAAASGEDTIDLEGIDLPTNGIYTIVVSGRSRGDRGTYQVVLTGNGPNNALPDDGPYVIDLLYGGTVSGEMEPDAYNQWNFRGCEGDEVQAVAVADGFAPELLMFHEIAEAAIATATPEPGSDGTTATLTRVLPRNGVYNLGINAVDDTDSGEFEIELTLLGNTPPVEETPTVISEFTPTPTPTATQAPNATPTPTPRAGVRRGTPTPRGGTPVQATPTPTATEEAIEEPTPASTDEFIMPGIGESAFSVINVSSSANGAEQWGPINHAAYTSDGLVIVTAGNDGVVRVWDALRGRLLQEIEGHEEAVNFIALSPDDLVLASASDDGTVRLWDDSGSEIAVLEMPVPDSAGTSGVSNGVLSIAFSPYGTQLVAASESGAVVVWDVESEEIALELEGHEGPVYTAIYNGDGTQIATGDGIGAVRFFDAESGELIDALPVNASPGGGDPILSISYVDDETLIVVGGVVGANDDSIQIWDLESGDPVGSLPNHGEWGASAVVRPGETHLLVAERANLEQGRPSPAAARLYDGNTGELAVAFVGFENGVVVATFSPDDDEVLLSDGNYLYQWPAPMIDVFAATYGEAIGVAIPEPTALPRATATPTPANEATPTPTPTPADEATATPTPTAADATPTPFLPTELQLYCTVTTDRLNLRPGPGTNYNPPITVLELGDLLVGIGRNADGSWLQVSILDDNLALGDTGWVSAEFVFCVGPDIEDLPVVEVE